MPWDDPTTPVQTPHTPEGRTVAPPKGGPTGWDAPKPGATPPNPQPGLLNRVANTFPFKQAGDVLSHPIGLGQVTGGPGAVQEVQKLEGDVSRASLGIVHPISVSDQGHVSTSLGQVLPLNIQEIPGILRGVYQLATKGVPAAVRAIRAWQTGHSVQTALDVAGEAQRASPVVLDAKAGTWKPAPEVPAKVTQYARLRTPPTPSGPRDIHGQQFYNPPKPGEWKPPTTPVGQLRPTLSQENQGQRFFNPPKPTESPANGLQYHGPVDVPTPSGPVTIHDPVVTPTGIQHPQSAPMHPIAGGSDADNIRRAERALSGAGPITDYMTNLRGAGLPDSLHHVASRFASLVSDGISSSRYLFSGRPGEIFSEAVNKFRDEQRAGRELGSQLDREVRRWLPADRLNTLWQDVERGVHDVHTDAWRSMHDAFYGAARAAGVDQHYVEDYFTHVIKGSPAQKGAAMQAVRRMVGPAPTVGATSPWSFERSVDTINQLQKLGYSVETNAANVIRAYANGLTNAVGKARLRDMLAEVPIPGLNPADPWKPALVKIAENTGTHTPVAALGAFQGYAVDSRLKEPLGNLLRILDTHGYGSNETLQWFQNLNRKAVALTMADPRIHGFTLLKRSATLPFTNSWGNIIRYAAGRVSGDERLDAVSHGLQLHVPSDIEGVGWNKLNPLYYTHKLLWETIAPSLQYGLYRGVTNRLSRIDLGVGKGTPEAMAYAKRLAAQQANVMMGKFLEEQFPRIISQYGNLMQFSRSYQYSQARQTMMAVGANLPHEMATSIPLTQQARRAVATMNLESGAWSIGMKYILGNAVQYARTGTLMIDNPPGHREDIWTGKRDGKGHKLMERYQLWTDRPLALLDMLASTAYDAILAAHKGMARGRIHGADWKGTGQDLSRMGQWAGNLQSPVARTAMDLRDAALGHGNRQQLMRDIPGANVPGSLPVVGPMIQNQVNRLEGRPRMPTDPTQQWLGVQQFPVSTRPDSTLNKRLLPQPRQWAHNLVGQ